MFDRVLPSLDRPLYASLCAGVAFATIIWLTSAYDVSSTRGWPTERAQVDSLKEHGGIGFGAVLLILGVRLWWIDRRKRGHL